MSDYDGPFDAKAVLMIGSTIDHRKETGVIATAKGSW